MSNQRLFISHASEDEAVVSRIVAYLEAHGVPCWVSSRDIPPRAIYADAITEAVRACPACAVVLSKASNQSKAVQRELELTSHYDKPFIPIRIDATEPAAGVDYYLRNTQWMDYKRDGERALDRIVAHMQGAPAAAPPVRARRESGGLAIAGIALAVVLIGTGAWYALTQSGAQPAGAQASEVSAETLAPLLGSYNWEGLECGLGPTISYEGSALVFTMPDMPTFRHQVLSAATRSGGELEVQTRVVSPEGHAGEAYSLGLNGDALAVSTQDENDTWTRCATPAR